MSNDYEFRQIEEGESGLAALAAAIDILGGKVTLQKLRGICAVSARGITPSDLAEIANSVGLTVRLIRCDAEDVRRLDGPALLVLHDNKYFVFIRATRKGALVFDPAVGRRVVAWSELERLSRGEAMDLRLTSAFTRRRERSPLNILSLVSWNRRLGGALTQVLILSILIEAFVIASPFFLQLSIDEVAQKGDSDLLTELAIGFAALAVFNAGAEALRNVAQQKIVSLLSWEMTQRLFRHLIRLPLPWFERRQLADVFTRFQALDPIKTLLASGLLTSLIDGILAVPTGVLMFLYAPTLAAAALASFLAYVLIRLVGIPVTRRFSMKSLTASIAEQGKRIETIRAIQTIKVMRAEAAREGDWANLLADSVVANQNAALASQSFLTVHKLFDSLVNVAVIYFGIKLVMAGQITIGVLTAYIAYQGQFLLRAFALFEQFVNWRMTDMYTFRLADIALTPTEFDEKQQMLAPTKITGAITAANMSFRYAPQEPFIFLNVSFKIEPGEFIAVVGASGAGKTTLLKMLAGLYQPTQGKLLLDNLPLQQHHPATIRRAVGVVMQDDTLLQGTIADNVSFFDRESLDLERVWACLELASIADEVEQMPMRASTPVAELGASLSGGQRQRLILARALYTRPQVLLLDEATSHLDVSRERIIGEALKALKITRIVAAHRPETLLAADRVFVIHNGRIDIKKAG